MTSIFIDGDKTCFNTKTAVERFKRDLRNNDTTKLATNDYFIKNWTYELVSKTESEMKVKLVETKKESTNSTKELLKQKLQSMKNNRTSQNGVKTQMKEKVPSELLDAYFNLIKVDKLRATVHPKPDLVIDNPAQYKNMIQSTVASFEKLKVNNPVTVYYRLLAKHLGLNNSQQTTAEQHNQSHDNTSPDMEVINKSTQDFINRLKNNTANINEDMSSIYESLGIKNTSKNDAIDKEMQNIFNSFATSPQSSEPQSSEPQQSNELPMDDEMKKIYESLGLTC